MFYDIGGKHSLLVWNVCKRPSYWVKWLQHLFTKQKRALQIATSTERRNKWKGSSTTRRWIRYRQERRPCKILAQRFRTLDKRSNFFFIKKNTVPSTKMQSSTLSWKRIWSKRNYPLSKRSNRRIWENGKTQNKAAAWIQQQNNGTKSQEWLDINIKERPLPLSSIPATEKHRIYLWIKNLPSVSSRYMYQMPDKVFIQKINSAITGRT